MKTETILTTYHPDEFKELVSGCIQEALKTEVSKIIPITARGTQTYRTRTETAKELSVTLPTLNAWEKAGILIPVRIGTRVRYKWEDIQEALDNSKKKPC